VEGLPSPDLSLHLILTGDAGVGERWADRESQGPRPPNWMAVSERLLSRCADRLDDFGLPFETH